MDKFRLLGYYHFPDQEMKPETEFVDKAKVLSKLLRVSINSLVENPETDDELKRVINDHAVLIFKDDKSHLYGFFTKDNSVRITNVKFSKKAITQVQLKYKAWFYPGRPIRLIRNNENNINNIFQNTNMGTKTTIPAPEVNTQAYEKVLDKMYVSAVKNRLNQLNNPSDNDRKRWIWELIQNAKDTIAKDPNRSSVDVRIEIEGDTVRFRHNGAPFTPDTRLGLLYKYSEDKEDQESTGRFGTGFLTTHCLSKVVNIESNMYSDKACTQLCGFSVTMYRDGLNAEELIDGLDKMRKSQVFYNETFDWTTFTYHVASESGRQAIKLGLENFHENIAQTMLFCKELASVVLSNNGKITTIVRKPTVTLENGIMLSEFEILGETHQIRRFIHTSYTEYNENLSKRYKAKRNICIDTAVEVDTENNLVDIEDNTTFFCVFPLVGIESQLNEPLIVNSPEFEPDHERQSLMLSGMTWNEEKDVITENGINRSIYEHIFPLYQKIVSYLASNQYGKLYYLANGLDRTKKHDNLDSEWYKQKVISKYREILMKYPVADSQDGSGHKKLEDFIIVKESVKKNEDKVYSLLQSLCPSKLVKDNHEWSVYLWKDGLSIWNTETLCSEIEKATNWNNLSLVNTNLSVWYNDFLKYILTYNELFLKEYAILPNMNGDLLKKDTKDFRQGEHINSFVIELLGKLGKDVRSSLLHEDITEVSLESKYNSQSYSAEINRLAKSIIDNADIPNKVDKLLPIITIIPNDAERYKQEFLSQRKEFFEICKALYQLTEATSVCDNHLLEVAWKDTDEWFVTNVLCSLKTLGSIAKLPTGLDAKWLNSALKSLKVDISKLNTYEVLPNQNGKFCAQNKLYEDNGVPETLKVVEFDDISLIYKDILLHKAIEASSFAINQKKSIASFASELKDKYASQSSYYSSYPYSINGRYFKYPQSTLDKVALYLLSLIPSDKETEVGKNQDSLYTTASNILGSEVVPCSETINYSSKDLWQDANFFVVSMINNKIKTAAKIETLNEQLGSKGEVYIFEQLNAFYDFLQKAGLSYNALNIFPNQEGEFCSINNLKKEEGKIDDIIKNIICLLVKEEEDYRRILMDPRCHLQPQSSLNSDSAYTLIDEKVAEFYKNPENWKDENFIEASQLLIENWGDKHKGTFEEKFPRIFDDKEKILMNVVWKKEKRELMMAVSTQLTEEQLRTIIEKSPEISGLSSKVKALEEENELLKNKLAELGIPISTIRGGDVTIGTGLNGNELASPEQIAESNEAKQLVLQKLEKEGFDVSKADSEYSVIHGVVRNNVNYPLVVKSCKNQEHRVWINPEEWRQLFKQNSMLWLHFGNGVVAPIKAYELFTYQDRLTLSFDTINLTMDNRINKIMEVLRFFNKVKLDLATLNPNKQRAEHLEEYLFNGNNADNSDLDDNVEL